MRVEVTSGDILDIPADVLICSANVGLRLSGGVGGALRIKFGNRVADRIQGELDDFLRSRGIAHANVTDVIETTGGGSPFNTIFHAVAIDGTYDSSIETIRRTVAKALSMCKTPRVSLAALATGYGRMTIKQFGQAIAPLLLKSSYSIEALTICLRHKDAADELVEALNQPYYGT